MLRVLGQTRWGEVRLRFRSRRAEALLGLLAVAGDEGLPRAEAGASLWPELLPERAAHNLRQNLVYLREALREAGAEEHLTAGRDRIAFTGPVDVREFSLAARGVSLEGLRRGLALDGGALLPGVEGDRVERARRRHEASRIELLLKLARATCDDDPTEALRLAGLAAEADPMLEAARRETIEILLAQGERARAREAFSEYDRFLRHEVGFGASGALRQLAFEEEESAPTEDSPWLSPTRRLALAVAQAPIYEAENRPEAGRRRLLEALAEAKAASRDLRSAAIAWISRMSFALVDWPLAVEQAREAERLAQGASALALARAQLARGLAWTGALPEAAATAQAALRGAKACGELEIGAEALLAWAAASWHAGRMEEARRLYSRAIRWARRAEAAAVTDRAVRSLASVRFAVDGPHVALETLEAFLQEGSVRITSNGWVPLQADIGRFREGTGDLPGAREAYVAALSGTQDGRKSAPRAQCLTYLADLDLREGKIESAVQGHTEAVALRRMLGDRVALATSLRGLGKARLGGGQAQEAKVALEEAMSMFDSEAATALTAACLLPLAWAHLALGERREAEQAADRAFAILESLDERTRRAHVNDGSLGAGAVEALRKALPALPPRSS